jgi:uncharacterized membrane protein
MKVKFLVTAIVMLVIINVAALGSFWYIHAKESRDRNPGREWRMRNMGKDLPREDRERLIRMVQGFRRDVRPLLDETRRLEDEMMESLRKETVSRDHIDSLNVAISQNRLEISRRATERMIAMGDSLEPAQREHMMRTLMRTRRSQYDDGERPRWLID